MDSALQSAMTPSRFQFTIKGLLWATFWLAVSFAAFGVAFARPDFVGSHLPSVLLAVLALLTGVLTTFIALGSLFGNAKRGLSWGLIACSLLGLLGFMLFGDAIFNF